MEKFKVRRKGYDVKEVDEYLVKIAGGYDKVLLEHKDRILALEQEKAELQKKVKEYESKREEASLALAMAVEKARNIEYASKVRYCLEGERLSEFARKWTDYVNTHLPEEIAKQNDSLTQYLNDAKAELQSMLDSGLNIKKYVSQADMDFMAEQERLLAE
ncbi:MAG: DivIVA domain-containing protein [Clostridia bacterium]|nr:DivIVA domain-containing protein [Clostridia bacterium]MDY4083800.1 DivIVA domain-containing protein [Eubacteriales bacterium]